MYQTVEANHRWIPGSTRMLPGLAVVFIAFATACGSAPYPNTFEGLVECIYTSMEGSLTRPLSHPYVDSPYLTDLDPESTIVAGRIAVSDKAWQHFESQLKVSANVLEKGNACHGVRTYPTSELGLAGPKSPRAASHRDFVHRTVGRAAFA